MTAIPQPSMETVLSELERERKAIDEAIAAYKELQEKLARLSPHLSRRVAGAAGLPVEAPALATAAIPPAGQQAQESDGSLTAKIVELLHASGQPMRGADIAKALAKAGVQTSSHRGMSAMVLSKLQKRTDLFANVSRGVYKLRTANDKPARQDRTGRRPSAAPGQRPVRDGFFSETELLGKSGSDLAGHSAVRAAIKVMSEHPDRPMHYKEIAAIAKHRGYSSGRADSEGTIQNTFRELLRRDASRSESLIMRCGGGRYKLKENHPAKANGG